MLRRYIRFSFPPAPACRAFLLLPPSFLPSFAPLSRAVLSCAGPKNIGSYYASHKSYSRADLDCTLRHGRCPIRPNAGGNVRAALTVSPPSCTIAPCIPRHPPVSFRRLEVLEVRSGQLLGLFFESRSTRMHELLCGLGRANPGFCLSHVAPSRTTRFWELARQNNGAFKKVMTFSYLLAVPLLFIRRYVSIRTLKRPPCLRMTINA